MAAARLPSIVGAADMRFAWVRPWDALGLAFKDTHG